MRSLAFPRRPALLVTDRIGLTFAILGLGLAALYAFGGIEFTVPTTEVFSTLAHFVFWVAVGFILICRAIRWNFTSKF